MTDTPPVAASSSPMVTALYERHVALGAKIADFGGWSMPIEYAGQGVLAEHAAVRERVGLFDVSHLGTASVTGPGAAALVDACFTNALSRISPGRAQYTMCCDDATGGVVDDLIVYLRSPDDVLLVPNAANSAEVLRRVAAAAPAGVTVTDRHADVAVLAVQGPLSDDVMAATGLPAGHGYMSFVDGALPTGEPATVCRTGYTGERGYEVLVDSAIAPQVWDALLAAVRERDGLPCGLGARDTLRTEMGYPLHGHELGPDITPVQARSSWAVGWDKPAFWGRDPLLAERERGAARLLWGLRGLDRGVLRGGLPVLRGDDPVGVTTSGTFSPTLRVPVALGLLRRGEGGVAAGDELSVDVRGRRLRVEVVKPPFVPSHVQ